MDSRYFEQTALDCNDNVIDNKETFTRDFSIDLKDQYLSYKRVRLEKVHVKKHMIKRKILVDCAKDRPMPPINDRIASFELKVVRNRDKVYVRIRFNSNSCFKIHNSDDNQGVEVEKEIPSNRKIVGIYGYIQDRLFISQLGLILI